MLPNTGWRRHGDNLSSFRKKLHPNTVVVDVFFNNTLYVKKCIETDRNIGHNHYMKADQPAPKDTYHTQLSDEWGSSAAPHMAHREPRSSSLDAGQDTAKRSRTTPRRGRPQATGPRTAAGKARSSKNATKHGATSITPINAHEHEVYETFLRQLRAQYPSNNPLVTLQLERITHLKVQIARIQTAISALHEIERLRLDDIERAAQVMNLTDEDRSHLAVAWRRAMSRDHHPESRPYDGLIPVAIELTEIDDLDLFTTHEAFLKHAPMFCEYLVKRAAKEAVDVKDYARSKQIKEPVREVSWGDSQPGKKTTELPAIRIRFLGSDDTYEINTDIRDVDVADLVKTAKWHRLELMRIITRSERVSNLQRVSEIASHAALPDLDKLDRLMRYQTTVNRQLSTAIGELLELLKH
jgi:hypothetical protein